MSMRKTLAGGLMALAFTATACGSDPTAGADGSDTLTITYGCLNTFSNLPRMIAEDVGLDEEIGLEIECSNIPSGPELAGGMVSGEIGATQMIPGNMTPLLDQGESLVAFAGTSTIEVFQLLIRSDYDLPNESEGWEGVMQDLEGANIGVVARGGSSELLVRGLFEQAGVDPEAQTYLTTDLAAVIAGLSTGQIDASLATEPYPTIAVHDGTAVQPFTIGDETGPAEMQWGSMMMITGRAYAEEHTEELCWLKTLFAQGADYIQDPDNRDHVVEVMEREMNLETEVAELTLDRNAEHLPENLDLDPELWDPNFAFLHETGAADNAYTAEDYSMDVCA